MKKPLPKTFVIGLCVIVALAVVVFGINYLKGVNMFKAANYYYASYTNVAGLNLSAPVTINGYKVGLVREIEYDYDNPGHIQLELSLDRSLKLTKGTRAVLVTDMLGTGSIELIMGEGKDFLPVGSTIEGSNQTGMMSEVSNNLLPGITAMIPKIDSLLTAVTAVAANPSIPSALNHLDGTLAQLEQASSQLHQLMGSMPGIVNDAGATMKNVHTMSGNLATVSSDLTAVSSTLKGLPLDATMNNVMEASKSLNQLLAQLNSGMNSKDSSLGMLVNDPSLYNNLSAASASLNALLEDLKANPKRYISIKLF